MATINALFEFASRILLSLERHFYTYLRIAIFVVMAWIGGLKVCHRWESHHSKNKEKKRENTIHELFVLFTLYCKGTLFC